jgi:hypothetical protein
VSPLIAPGTVAGVVPWLISHWQFKAGHSRAESPRTIGTSRSHVTSPLEGLGRRCIKNLR